MARPPPSIDNAIAAPPLPGFYQRAIPTSTESSISTSSILEVPSPLVCHICRICLRTRSTRYHQEHPIPFDGVPPPPGICRRCRVVSVDDIKSVAQIELQSESKDVGLGVRCLVPDVDYFTSEEMKSRRVRHILARTNRAHFEPRPSPRPQPPKDCHPKQREEVIYRHIHIAGPPPPPPFPPYPPPHPSPARLGVFADQDAQHAVRSTSQQSSKHGIPRKAGIISSQSPPVLPIHSPPFAAAAALRRTHITSAPDQTVPATPFKSKRSSISRTCMSKGLSACHTEAEVRRLARDEIVRYRQAERKLEAHGDPYAHGRLVPVEQERIPVARRIELQTDLTEQMPWHSIAAETRRDSAFAVPVYQKTNPKPQNRERVVLTYRSGESYGRDREDATQAASSSCSSDKTRWPTAEVMRTHWVKGDTLRKSAIRSTERTKSIVKSATRRDLQISPTQEGEVPDATEQKEFPEEHRPSEKARHYRITRKNSDLSGNGAKLEEATYRYVAPDAATKTRASVIVQPKIWTDREDWDCGESTSTAKKALMNHTLGVSKVGDRDVRSGNKPVRKPAAPHERVLIVERVHRRDEQAQGLPYPYDDHETPVQMHSPSSRASQPVNSISVKDPDRVYFHKKRTVDPLSNISKEVVEMRPGEYYRETEEYLHRRKSPQDHFNHQQSIPNHAEAKQRRPSDISSRVRFSNKLDISPTPPGSDASSSQFRSFGGRKNDTVEGPDPESDEDLIVEYEHRGRPRSRPPSRAHDFYYERDLVHSHKRCYRPVDTSDRDRTPRPALSETATGVSMMPSNIKPIAQALSESPSREKLRAAAMRQHSDGLPPYAAPASPTASVMVEDGSTLTNESNEIEARREHGGRRVKR